MMPTQTTKTVMVLLDNVRGPISNHVFSSDEKRPESLSNLNRDSSAKKAHTLSSFIQDGCSQHHVKVSFLWFTVTEIQTTGRQAKMPPALSSWATVISEMDVPISQYMLRDNCVAVADLCLLARSLK
ncbi:hypothetical protein TNCV_4034141 [Trichonephila clavipes]|nr:hypothetical protein TNCV_4034141 [Trichonephila clavipes]